MSERSSHLELPTQVEALGLRLRVLPGEPQPPPAESAWCPADLMERPTRVAVLRQSAGVHRLALDVFGDYTVDVVDGTVRVHRGPATGLSLAEVLDGPILLHALASRGVHVLHASAVLLPDGRVVGFTADSGTGKSTLAAHARRQGAIRVADDLLAVRIDAGGIVVLPGLPQPKLNAADQPGPTLPAQLPLAALGRLQRVDGPAGRQRLSPFAALDLVVRATVASRVYAPDSLAAHLRFAGAVAEAVSAQRLQVSTIDLPDRPSDIDGALDEVYALLQG